MEKAAKPFTAIMGGAKISDKILIIENLLDKVNNLIIGGGMAYTFFKALGGSIGNSLVEEDKLDLAKELIQKAKTKGVDLILPIDSVIADKFAADANTQVTNNNAIPNGWMGLDIGPQAISVFKKAIEGSKTILWNGPMGVFEMEKFAEGTKTVAQAVVTATQKGGFSLIGGGDSAAAVAQLGFSDKGKLCIHWWWRVVRILRGKSSAGCESLGIKFLVSNFKFLVSSSQVSSLRFEVTLDDMQRCVGHEHNFKLETRNSKLSQCFLNFFSYPLQLNL